jgi:ankyrin repeat protein
LEKTGHTEVIKELLASEDPKVDVTLVDNKKLTALMLADKNGHDEVVKLFTDEKYDKNIQQAGQLEKNHLE